MQTTSGEEVSTGELKNALKALVDEEDKKKPLTDDELVILMEKKGYQIALLSGSRTRAERLAKDLQGKLLLIHGTADDNVHFQQTMDYAESLVQAGKQFEMQVYKDRNHSIYGGNTRYHLYTRMSNFLFDNL